MERRQCGNNVIGHIIAQRSGVAKVERWLRQGYVTRRIDHLPLRLHSPSACHLPFVNQNIPIVIPREGCRHQAISEARSFRGIPWTQHGPFWTLRNDRFFFLKSVGFPSRSLTSLVHRSVETEDELKLELSTKESRAPFRR